MAASCRGCRSGPENQDLFPCDVFPDDDDDDDDDYGDYHSYHHHHVIIIIILMFMIVLYYIYSFFRLHSIPFVLFCRETQQMTFSSP